MKNTLIFSTILFISCTQTTTPETKVAAKAEISKPKADSTISITSSNAFKDTLYTDSVYIVTGTKSGTVKLIKKNQLKQFPEYKELYSYKNDIFISKDLSYRDVLAERKYKPLKTFADYPAEFYNGKLARPNFSTNPSAKRFRSAINYGCDRGINFAGHYTIVEWRCGSPCQNTVIVDRITGKIYDGYITSYGSEYNVTSRLILLDYGTLDTVSNLITLGHLGEFAAVEWTGSKFKPLK